jgi:hypothetical protein
MKKIKKIRINDEKLEPEEDSQKTEEAEEISLGGETLGEGNNSE